MKSRISTIISWLIFVSVTKAQQWSPCSKTCGGGTKTMKYCLWGNICSTIHRGCMTQPCIIGSWGDLQPCSKTCGGGTTFSVEKCAYNKLELCPKIYEDCNTHKCKEIPGGCKRGYGFRYEDDSSCCKIVHGDCGVDPASSRRIVGGKDALPGDWPWMAALVKTAHDSIQCGGTLIHKRWVVTAAHCFDPPEEKIYILLGSITIKNRSLGSVKRTVEDTKIHPDYKYPKHDIALVKMNDDVTFTSHIKPICLPTGEITPIDKTCVMAGWGRTKWSNKSSFTNKLQQVKIRTLPMDACIQGYQYLLYDPVWRSFDKLYDICAGILDGKKDACRGDSGGPLMCQRCSTCGWYLAGVASYGPKVCGKAGVPAIYMNVYNYQYWIQKYVSISTKEYFVC